MMCSLVGRESRILAVGRQAGIREAPGAHASGRGGACRPRRSLHHGRPLMRKTHHAAQRFRSSFEPRAAAAAQSPSRSACSSTSSSAFAASNTASTAWVAAIVRRRSSGATSWLEPHHRTGSAALLDGAQFPHPTPLALEPHASTAMTPCAACAACATRTGSSPAACTR